MADAEAPGTTILLIHDGELADVRDLLDELGLGYDETAPNRVDPDQARKAQIVISTPHFLLDRLHRGDTAGGVRIAIMDGTSRTVRAMLGRGGIEWLVRRPFHPTALRLLLLHCIYQGPEKRKAKRVSIGAAVHYHLGWRRRGALLAEMSQIDCRLLADRKVEVGKKVKLRLPEDLAGGRALVLTGKVVRTAKAPEGDGSMEVCILFDRPVPKDAARVKEMVESHRQGPAILAGSVARHLEPSQPGAAEIKKDGLSVITIRDRSAGDLDGGEDDEEALHAERRDAPRQEFRQGVVALGHEAARVLVGRDISLRGMRIDPSPNLSLDQELRIAIPVPQHATPLVVEVSVDRDDGERGLLLGFRNLSPTATTYLEDVLRELADLPLTSAAAGGGAYVVSEIVDSD
jgi:hypothetical protein